jgi:hypothetical protein
MHAKDYTRALGQLVRQLDATGQLIPLMGTDDWHKLIHRLQCSLKRCITRDERKLLAAASNKRHGARKAIHGKGVANHTERVCNEIRLSGRPVSMPRTTFEAPAMSNSARDYNEHMDSLTLAETGKKFKKKAY